MKKKLIISLSIVFVAILGVVLTLIFTLGNKDKDSHTHLYGEWQIEKVATCTEEGLRVQKCQVCEKTNSETIPKVAHALEPISDYVYHYYKCTACGYENNKVEHSWNINNICEECEYALEYTHGLGFTDIDESSCELTSIEGVLTDTMLIIPAYYNGKKVVSINSVNGLKSTNSLADNITFIVVPNTVKTISSAAFADFKSLEMVILSNSMETIEADTFRNCISLKKVALPKNLIKIGNYAFKQTHLMSIEIPNSVTDIGNNAFELCEHLNSVTLSNNLINIGNSAFEGCKNLNFITLTPNLKIIGDNAFLGTNIYEVVNLTSLGINSGNIGRTGLGFSGSKYDEERSIFRVIDSESQSYISTTSDGFRFYANGDKIFLINYIGESKDITLPQSFNGNDYIIFKNCFISNDILESVTIIDGAVEIMSYAFDSCENLTKLFILGGTETIRTFAIFSNRINTVVIGSSVKTIENSAFNSPRGAIFYLYEQKTPDGWADQWTLNLQRVKVYYATEWGFDENGEPSPLD